MITLTLLGAESAAELRGEAWLRPATSREEACFKAYHHLSALDFEAACLDSEGRPYTLVALLPGAPSTLHEKARTCLRHLRLASS